MPSRIVLKGICVLGGDGGGSNSPSRRYTDRDVLQVYPEIMFSCSGPVPARIKISLADCL